MNTNMKLTAKSCTSLLLALFFLSGNCLWAGKIINPWRVTTAIVKAGGSFEVWFDADNGQRVNTVTLQGPYNTVTATKTIATGSWVYDQTSSNTYNTKISIAVPIGAPADRYDLILHTSSGDVKSPRSVKVVKDFKTDYYILHISDTHAFQYGYDGTLEKISTIVDIANIIGPEMVFETGDNLYHPSDARMGQYFQGDRLRGTKGFDDFNAPVFIAAGNHDYEMDKDAKDGNYRAKAIWYNHWWGLQAFHFTYGEGRFMVINDAWDGYDPSWQIADALSWLNAVGRGNFRLGAAHIKNQEMEPFHKGAGFNMVLVGHNHHIASENPALLGEDHIQYVANSVRDHFEFNLFRVNGATGRCVPVSGPTAQVQVLRNPADIKTPALYQPNLTLEYLRPNDGSCSTNTATVENHYDFEISPAQIRFVVPKGSVYATSAGTIEQAFDGTSFHIVDVSVTVPAHSKTAVSLSAKPAK
jgi:predicted MPP superfamily phosphohydrolase